MTTDSPPEEHLAEEQAELEAELDAYFTSETWKRLDAPVTTRSARP